MTTRQWKLYNLLKTEPDKWFSQKEIADAVEGYEYKERANDRCPTIRDDKNEINASLEVDKIIVMKNYKFKIGTKEEYLEERKKHVRRLKQQVKIIQDFDFKVNRDGHGKLISNKGEVIDEKSKARRFFETFLSSEY